MIKQELIQIISDATKNKRLHLILHNNQLDKLPSEIGQLKNLTSLNLSCNQLSRLPSEIGQLSNLTSLDLSGNQLSELPSEIGQLRNLKILKLNENHLSKLPIEFTQLTNLLDLNLSDNRLPDLPRHINNLAKLVKLDFSCNNLNELPSGLSNLSNLASLNLSGNLLSDLSFNFASLSRLTSLNLGQNDLRELPTTITRLFELRTLNLSSNQLSELPYDLSNLTELRYLFLSNNQFSELPPHIGKLIKLSLLNLADNELEALPPQIGQLINLTALYLIRNKIQVLPSTIGNLRNLTALNLGSNKIRNLPSQISQLDKLAYLYLDNNQLSRLLPEIGKLTQLIEIDLSENQLYKLPTEIGLLTNLTELDVGNNPLGNLPSEVSRLTDLKSLSLRGTQLSQLPSKIEGLSNLTEINLNDSNLTELPPDIGQLTRLTGFYVDNSPLISPPLEIASKGIEAIRKYFASLEGESQNLNEIKILFVGEGSSGKTSLTKRISGEEFNENEMTTHGIRINDWQIHSENKSIKANIWDFGGQEIMHATHQFFLSKRSLYVLVLDGRRDERPEYWLRHIESFGGDSPILIVLNKFDANPGYNINRPFLQKKYPSICGFYRTSCSSGYGIDAFKNALIENLCQVTFLETRWANSWFLVKQRLEQMEAPYISYDQYEKICNESKITQVVSQDVLAGFLNDLGVIVHFQDFRLKDTHILEPKWVTEGVYKIINSNKAASNNGQVELIDLKQILKKQSADDYFYPISKHKYIIDLMRKFELCYYLSDNTILIPQLLDVVEPFFDFDFDSSLKFVLHYNDFLPLSIMPRFIVNRHQDIKDNLVWRTGVVLHNKAFESTAVIYADNESDCIKIYVNGLQQKDYFAAILLLFREINDGFEKLRVSELVPMPDDPDITITYKQLQLSLYEGIDKIVPSGAEKSYSVKDLLGLIQLEEQNILDMLQSEGRISDKESFIRIANKIFDLRPNVFGVGLNINELIENLWVQDQPD